MVFHQLFYGQDLILRRHVPGVQPRMMPHEYDAVEKLLLNHPEFLSALAKRGISDPTLVKAGVLHLLPVLIPPRSVVSWIFYRGRRSFQTFDATFALFEAH